MKDSGRDATGRERTWAVGRLRSPVCALRAVFDTISLTATLCGALVVLKVRHTGRGAGRRYHSTPRRPARSRSPSRDVGRSARRGELRTRPRDHARYALRNRIVLDYRIVGFRGVKVTSGCSLPSTYGVRSLRRHVPLSSSRENHHRQKAQEQGQKGDDAPKRPVTALGVFDHGAHLLLQRLHV